MAETDWGDIWTWSSGTPPPTDPSKGWVEDTTYLHGFHVANPATGKVQIPCLRWQLDQFDSNEMIGRFYNPSPETNSQLMRVRCFIQSGYRNWSSKWGIFLGNPELTEGNKYGGTEQDKINGVVFGIDGGTCDTTSKNLTVWVVAEGGGLYHWNYRTMIPVINTIDPYYAGSIYEIEVALLMDDTIYDRGGYNNGVFDANRMTGWAYGRLWSRWNNSGAPGYSTTSASWTWNGTATVTTSNTSGVNVGDLIKPTGQSYWYEVATLVPNSSVTIITDGRRFPDFYNTTTTLDHYTPIIGTSWTDWQSHAEVNISTPSWTMMKNMIEGAGYYVGPFVGGSGWAAADRNVHFADMKIWKGTPPP